MWLCSGANKKRGVSLKLTIKENLVYSNEKELRQVNFLNRNYDRSGEQFSETEKETNPKAVFPQELDTTWFICDMEIPVLP